MLPFPHERNKSLRELTTIGIGGPALYYAEVRTKEQLAEMLLYSFHNALPCLVLGKGSNCLFDDRGFKGLIIHNRIDYLRQEENLFHVGAGYSFARLGGLTARQGWMGLEFASGIPATVGGAIFMNAGANGKETADCLVQVEYLTEKGESIRLLRSDLTFGYRSSSFQQWKGSIVEGTFSLMASEDVKKKQKEILNYRLKTQPYGDKSAGCAFRNPSQGAAGRLIEECGLKGLKIGDAEVSTVHANFIVNADKATAEDVRQLMEIVKEKVYKKTGIILEEEIRWIPYEF